MQGKAFLPVLVLRESIGCVAVFMQALASSLRLAGEPAPADAAAADAVFGRLMALHKGRALLARTLHALDAPLCTLEPPPDPDPNPSGGPDGQADAARAPAPRSKPSPLRPLWAVLRNARVLFGAGVRAGVRAGAGPGGSVGGPEAMADAAVTELGATAQLARAAAKVTQGSGRGSIGDVTKALRGVTLFCSAWPLTYSRRRVIRSLVRTARQEQVSHGVRQGLKLGISRQCAGIGAHSTSLFDVQCALQVLRRLEMPGTICACGSALAAGDLGAPPGGPAAASPAAALLPMFAAGDRSGGHRAWLADVLAALLLSAQVRLS